MGLIALSVGPLAFGLFRISQLLTGAEVTADNARFFASPVPVVIHVVSAAVFALLGAVQFASGFRRRHPKWHRVAGRVSLVAGVLVAASALWMTVFYPRAEGTSELLTLFRLVFGSAMLASIALGFVAIRKRDVRGHQAWITRGYALGLGAGTQMFTLGLGEVVLGPLTPAENALLQASAWVINLVVAERSIRGRRQSV